VPLSFTIGGHDDFVITSNEIKYQFRFLKKISSNGIKIPLNPPEGVKKLEDCATAHRVGRLVQALEGGLLDVMGNLRFW
jgi:hypothetical protein